MPFKKINAREELEQMCKDDKELAEYVKEFNEAYDENIETIKIKAIKRNELHNIVEP